jgi:S-DNA-T family DNA segregation ATPase FtsK/SpoIIIE
MHAWYNTQARLRRLFGMGPRKRRDHAFDAPYDFNDDEFGTLNEPVRAKAPVARGERVEPSMDGPAPRRVVSPPSMSIDDDEDEDDDPSYERELPRPAGILPDDEEDEWALRPASPKVPGGHRVVPAAARPKPGIRAEREAQTSFIRPYGFQLPAVHLLAEPKAIARDATLSSDALEQNARMLEGVLEDFGVKGEIIHVRPGPVVTLYELEPAPGIKSSRVIGLADDIARSMSAVSARVAVVSGRNAIGIELPNPTREKVYLRELLDDEDYNSTTAKLALCLGKTIGGESVIVDLARMPHLLIAGTTGSGKSVAINTMILSLVYRLRPDQCRLIMVDPKMLELSVYDGIPHLLTPVVTDPKKAVVALKWAVREMEERYKRMSKLGVRNVDGYNARLAEAKAKGETLTRTVHTGYDKETGAAIYEKEELELEPLPYIVVIVDEMADLMMVAGKDIEGAIQRLAQMARAAGIHVILATQRPSVDVITGTIKANFPTRISFQVPSKIDSRTILGEQGAEQLLGQGDMLYMAGGGRIRRVHGPFVSDDEVEKVVRHLKSQGVPQYLEEVTAGGDEEGDDGAVFDATGMGLAEGGDLYQQAVAIVKRDRKASTSYIQRRLQIGYNRAATIMERMEEEGIVGQPNHAGKREILIPENPSDDRY